MYKLHHLHILTAAILMISAITSCNESSSSSDVLDTSGNSALLVNSFKIKADEELMSGLDSVYFTIDLNGGRVFNADSLPVGTRIDSLGINLTYSSNATVAKITMPGVAQTDTVVEYNAEDSQIFNFSRGYVTLHLETEDGRYMRDYRIQINVHNMYPDTLAWGDAAWGVLPTNLNNLTGVKTIDYQGRALCFAQNASETTLAVSDNPATGSWNVTSVTLPTAIKLSTVTAGDDAIYALGESDALYVSADEGSTWTATGAEMSHIYGVYQGKVLGCKSNGNGGYIYVTYPASSTDAVPADAPVRGTTSAITYTSSWATSPMMLVMGGVSSSGSNVGATWAYDGKQWAQISNTPTPGLADAMMVPYFSVKVGRDWVASYQTVLLLFGGTASDGNGNKSVYVSYDRGVNWTLAPSLLQLPAHFPILSGASAVVFDQTYTSRSSRGLWNPLELPVIPSALEVPTVGDGITPVTQWECPYIYVYGGKDDSGTLNTHVWRGAINRLKFKPLQ